MPAIHCESCDRLIAEHSDWDEAVEIAFENEAHRDAEAGIWNCDPCYAEAWNEYAGQFRALEAEANLRAMQNDAHENGPMTAYLRAKGEL